MSALRAVTAACLGLALAGGAARAQAEPSASWVIDHRGRPLRVRFDPGHRLFVGAGTSLVTGSQPGASVEVGLLLRAPRPPDFAEADVFWKRDHELGHLRLRSGGDGAWVEGRVYGGTFLRHARDGSVTMPTTPPLRLPFPFDVGLKIDLGRFLGPASGPSATSSFTAGVVRGEMMIDVLRSERLGRSVCVGVVGFYDVTFSRTAGALAREHNVAPLTTVAASARAESASGLLTAAGRVEWGRAWSSDRGWGQRLHTEAALELTPVALNDLPVSFLIEGSLDVATAAPRSPPAVRLFAGLRLGIPLRE